MRAFRSFAWFAFFVPLAAYVWSLPPGVSLWDTGEMQVVPWIFGVPHATGFPAFVLLAGIFAHLEPFGNPGWRISLFSALAMAGAAATLALFLREFALPRWVAVLGAWIFAFGDTVWSRGSRAEVQALAVLFIALTLLFCVRWSRTKDTRDAVVAAASWGFGIATHPVALFLGAGVFVVAILGRRALTTRRAATILGAFFAPLLLYAYIPLRSAYLYRVRRDPTLALGLPPGQSFWDTDHAAGGLTSYLDRAPGQVGGGVAGMLDPAQWSKVGSQYGVALVHEFGWLCVVFGVVGLLMAVRDRPLLWLGMIVSVSTTIPFILNFPESDGYRYFLGSFWLFAAAIAIGVYHGVREWTRRLPAGNAIVGLVLVVLLGSQFVDHGARLGGGRNDTKAPDWVARVRAETEPNAIIIATWMYATPLGYEVYDVGDFGDRIPISGSETQYAAHFATWLKTRPVYVSLVESALAMSAKSGLQARAVDDRFDVSLYKIERIGRASAK